MNSGTKCAGASPGSVTEMPRKKASFHCKNASNETVCEVRISDLQGNAYKEFETRVSTLLSLNHINIVKYRNVLYTGEFAYIFMECYPTSLDMLIAGARKNGATIAEEIASNAIYQIACAIAYLHNPDKHDVSGTSLPIVLHKDLKPKNILLDDTGTRFIVAGLSLREECVRTKSTSYAAPEILMEGAYSPASDMWAVGCIFYELLTGEVPDFLMGRSARSVYTKNWTPNLNKIKDINMHEIVSRLFTLTPKDRMSANELVEMLRKKGISAAGSYSDTASKQDSALHSTLSDSQYAELLHRFTNLETDLNALVKLYKGLEERLSFISPLEESIKVISSKMVSLETQLTTSNSLLQESASDAPVKFATNQLSVAGFAQPPIDYCAASDKDQLFISTTVTSPNKFSSDFSTNYETTMLLTAANTEVRERQTKRTDEDDRNKCKGDVAADAELDAGQLCISNILSTHGGLVATDSDKGVTDLMKAAAEGSMEDILSLVSLQKEKVTTGSGSLSIDGAELYFGKGTTALMFAAQWGHMDAVKFLFDHEYQASGWTNLIYAAVIGDVDMVNNNITQSGKRDLLGCTALMRSIQANHIDIIRILAKHEESIVDVDDTTALMIAASRGNIEAVKILMHGGKRRYDTAGETALMLAARSGHLEVVELLMEHEHGMKSKSGQTALDIAREDNHRDIINVLSQYPDEADTVSA